MVEVVEMESEMFGETLVHFRSMCVADLEGVRALHEALFPVRYSNSYVAAQNRRERSSFLQVL